MFSTPVRMIVEWYVPTGQARPVTMALHALASETRTMRGCLGCSVATDLANKGTVRYTEEWLSEPDLRDRLRADTFGQLLAMMEETTSPPVVEFVLDHEKRGLDFATEVRESLS
jgi:quinol monooxygenase YgiN